MELYELFDSKKNVTFLAYNHHCLKLECSLLVGYSGWYWLGSGESLGSGVSLAEGDHQGWAHEDNGCLQSGLCIWFPPAHRRGWYKLPLWWSCSHASLAMCGGPSETNGCFCQVFYHSNEKSDSCMCSSWFLGSHFLPLCISFRLLRITSMYKWHLKHLCHTLFSGKLRLRQFDILQSSSAWGSAAFSPQ